MASRRFKQALMARQRRSDGTFMDGDYMEPWARSGSFGVNPDGSSYPIYPGAEAIKRDNRGRFTSEYGNTERNTTVSSPVYNAGDWPFPGRVPPVYRDNVQSNRRIGFVPPDEAKPGQYKSRADMTHMDESAHRKGKSIMGYADSDMDKPIPEEVAMEWVRSMKNADGTTGPHWTVEQVRQIMEQHRIKCDEIEFFVAINMMYSDYCKAAKKSNCSTVEFYAAMAKAFLDDKDAEPGKLNRYYEYIVEH